MPLITNLNTIVSNAISSNYSDAVIKVKYENNADTNAFTDAEKTKLDVGTALTTTATTLSTGVNELQSNKMDKAQNLADVANIATARSNLDVYSTAEVQTEITNAGLALGSNFAVANITARDAMAAGSLTVGDNVFVTDDGDTKWAIYKVTVITDGAGSTSTFEKVMDEDVFLNAQSAAAIKATYESNADTNAYTDAEKNKLANIENNATADQTASEIETLYEGIADTNKYTDEAQARVARVGASSTTLLTTSTEVLGAINEIQTNLTVSTEW